MSLQHFNSNFFATLFPGIKYDAEKEEKQLQEARQRELQRIEETKLKAAEQGWASALSLRRLCMCCPKKEKLFVQLSFQWVSETF